MSLPLRLLSVSLAGLALFTAASASGQLQITTPPAQQRIVQPVDNSRLTRLTGNVHPALASATDLGPVSASLPMERLQLVLQRSPERQAAFDAFTASQYSPSSPNYHHWLSPDEVGSLFGISDADLATVTSWLQTSGFTVTSVSKGRLTLEFSGTAAQVQQAFHTQIHTFSVNGEQHIANVSDPQIPSALTPVVTGLLSLNNFFPRGQMVLGQKLDRDASGKIVPSAAANNSASATPLFDTSGGGFYVSPQDFATIYNSLPTWNSGITGAGVDIAIVGRSEILPSDIASFQASFGLPNNPPTIIHNGPTPTTTNAGDLEENSLDIEWSGAAAPGAKINFVTSASTSTSDGGSLSEIYIIDNQVAPIMSASYGLCELALGTSGNAFYNSLWQQAAAEGISVFISSGDQDSAGCDNNSQTAPFLANLGLAVNGLASSPYVTAVGGTDFNDYSTTSTYWNTANTTTGLSAKGYIPEIPWNSTCANPAVAAIVSAPNYTPAQICNAFMKQNINTSLIDTVGGSGGVSACTTPTSNTVASCSGGYAKPSWQTGTGVPADGKRDLPDVSLFASSGFLKSAYIITYKGNLYGVGGTSVSSPAMAGIMSLIVQKLGTAQGLANPTFYTLASQENLSACNSSTVTNGNSCIFYDTTYGSIVAPCAPNSPNCVTVPSDPLYDGIGVLSGYTTTTGYDQATGLGSVNVTNLVSGWKNVAPAPTTTTITLTSSIAAFTVGTAYYQQITASGGTAPYTYFVSSGSLPSWLTLTPNGVLTGTPPAISSFSFTITARDSSLNGPFAGSQAYTQTVAGASTSTITWIPATLSTYSGLPIGANVLNASSSLLGTFAYTATLANDGSPIAVTSATVLSTGTYTLTATFTPSAGAPSSASIPFTVTPEHVWVVNSSGSLVVLDAAGNTYAAPSGGGMGIAIDNGGTVWSGATSGTSLSAFSNNGYATNNSPAVGGISSPTAIAIDGNGYIWTANANNSVSAISPLGVAFSPSTGFAGGNINTPSGIAIDISGNVWISNSGNNSVTEILGGAAPVEPLSTAQTQRNLGAKP